jgi:enamine deaminase RidA (YjgF/YER057c/UK114 family)
VSPTRRYGSGGPYEASLGYSRLVVAGPLATAGPAASAASTASTASTASAAWTAGCTAIVDGDVVGVGDANAQALAAFGVGLAALERAGFRIGDVVQTRMYVVDIGAHSGAVGRAHAELFGDVRPAATMLGVAALIDPRLLVEVELVAVRDDAPTDLRGDRP